MFLLMVSSCSCWDNMKTGTATGPEVEQYKAIILKECFKQNGPRDVNQCQCVVER